MWVKICGITNPENAVEIAKLQPDAIGLNFYPASKRYVTPETAATIVSNLPESIEPIGLFVNSPIDNLCEIYQSCQLQTIQLHGDESPEYLAELLQQQPHMRIIRAFRYGKQALQPLAEDFAQCQQLAISLRAYLIDAAVNGEYGGTGQTIPWSQINEQYDFQNWPQLIVAGGLNAANVATAIKQSQPWGVDTASGVERAPGIKEISFVQQFIQNARAASSANR